MQTAARPKTTETPSELALRYWQNHAHQINGNQIILTAIEAEKIAAACDTHEESTNRFDNWQLSNNILINLGKKLIDKNEAKVITQNTTIFLEDKPEYLNELLINEAPINEAPKVKIQSLENQLSDPDEMMIEGYLNKALQCYEVRPSIQNIKEIKGENYPAWIREMSTSQFYELIDLGSCIETLAIRDLESKDKDTDQDSIVVTTCKMINKIKENFTFEGFKIWLKQELEVKESLINQGSRKMTKQETRVAIRSVLIDLSEDLTSQIKSKVTELNGKLHLKAEKAISDAVKVIPEPTYDNEEVRAIIVETINTIDVHDSEALTELPQRVKGIIAMEENGYSIASIKEANKAQKESVIGLAAKACQNLSNGLQKVKNKFMPMIKDAFSSVDGKNENLVAEIQPRKEKLNAIFDDFQQLELFPL